MILSYGRKWQKPVKYLIKMYIAPSKTECPLLLLVWVLHSTQPYYNTESIIDAQGGTRFVRNITNIMVIFSNRVGNTISHTLLLTMKTLEFPEATFLIGLVFSFVSLYPVPCTCWIDIKMMLTVDVDCWH